MEKNWTPEKLRPTTLASGLDFLYNTVRNESSTGMAPINDTSDFELPRCPDR